MTDFKNFSLQNTVANIEGQMDSGDLPLDEDDDVIPQAAADMGTGTLVIVYTVLVIFKNI